MEISIEPEIDYGERRGGVPKALIRCAYDCVLLRLYPSETLTVIVQLCSFPVVFVGAVHIGVWLFGLSKRPFDPNAVEQRVDQL